MGRRGWSLQRGQTSGVEGFRVWFAKVYTDVFKVEVQSYQSNAHDFPIDAINEAVEVL